MSDSQKVLLRAIDALGAEENRTHRANPLHFSTLQLLRQPNGGHGRVLIKIRPYSLPEEVPLADMPCVYCDMETTELHDKINRTLVKPFWFRTNEGSIALFETDFEQCKRVFGVQHGERVLSTWGPSSGTWSTVIGIRGGCLWVKDDGAQGATALYGLSSRAALEGALGWVSHGCEYVSPCTTVQVPVISYDRTKVELRRLTCDPATMELCFGKGRLHGSIHAVTTVPFDGAAGPLLMVPVGVDITNGDLIAFFVSQTQSEASATMLTAVGGGSTFANVPSEVLDMVLFGVERVLPLNRSVVIPSVVFATTLEGVQNPEGVTALLRPEQVSKESARACLSGGAIQTRARSAASNIFPAAKIISHEGHSSFLAYREKSLPISLFCSPNSHSATSQPYTSIREPSVRFYPNQ